MNREEAKRQTEIGIWSKISPVIVNGILDACDDGLYEITINKILVSEDDVDRLIKLGYSVTFDGSNKFCPEYYISWKYD